MAGSIDYSQFIPPFWLPEGQSQTILGSRFASYPRIQFYRQRIITHDNDFIDLDWHIPHQEANSNTPLPSFTGRALVLFHGLEGSSKSHYAQSICHDFKQQGWAVVVANFRGCSGELNLLPRSYFSGDIQDVDTVMQAIKTRLPHAQWYAVGISMGGSVLLNYLGRKDYHSFFLNAAAGISTPTNLVATGHQLGKGFFGKYIYTTYFLHSMKEKMRQKSQHFPDIISYQSLKSIRTLQDFDNQYTAPIHGFKDAIDYWTQCSSHPFLKNIHIPTLILNAKNDPFIPKESLPSIQEVSSDVLLHQPEQGGHVGFSQGRFPSRLGWLSQRLNKFFSAEG